jgi:glycosyltransferase involved in cell wall biosynthesis
VNKPPKILALIPYKVFPPNMGGQRAIVLFYRSLCKLIPLTAFTIKANHSAEDFDIIPTISNSKYRYINPFLFFQLKKNAKQHNVTHILFEHPYYAWLLFLIKHFTIYKTIIHSHNIESERFKSIGKPWWKILWFYEKWAYKNADIVWFITEYDKQYAIEKYHVLENKALVIPYGTDLNISPSENELLDAKRLVQNKHNIKADEAILLFNGALGYQPNLEAVISIIEKINPILIASNYHYKIIICGKGLPSSMNELKEYRDKNIIYAGFVDDIDLYFKACDIFINPLNHGGGIKTKLVEALGFGKIAVSTKNGAIGISEAFTEGRLKIVDDNDWAQFTHEIIHSKSVLNSNQLFYNHYSWDNISKKALDSILL